MIITIQTLDTNNRTLPAGLEDKPFDSKLMQDRFAAFLAALAPRLTDAVDGVLLANIGAGSHAQTTDLRSASVGYIITV